MSIAIQVSARIGTMILSAARGAGVDAGALAAACGFDPALAADPDGRIALDIEESLWDGAARLSGDRAFGLHAARQLRPGLFGAVDYALRSSSTFREALSRLARYNRLVHDVAVFRVHAEHDKVRIEHAFQGTVRRPNRHASEFTLAAVMTIGRQLVTEHLVAVSVCFAHPDPKLGDEHLLAFGVRPTFDAQQSELVLDRGVVESPLTSDPGLAAVLDRHVESLLASLPAQTESLSCRVRRLLVETLADGEPSLRALALRIKTSERTLQRRLADEGTSFYRMVDELRRELALRHLASTSHSIAEVAWLLGYSEASAFHRTFKRWMKKTPAEYRRSVLRGDGADG